MQDIVKDLTPPQRELLEWLYLKKAGGRDPYRDGNRAISYVGVSVRQDVPLAKAPQTVITFTLREQPHNCSECGTSVGHRTMTVEVVWSERSGRSINVLAGGSPWTLSNVRLPGDPDRKPKLSVSRLQRIVEAWLDRKIRI